MAFFGLFGKKKEGGEKDVLFPKIDLHTHILPGVDDGSRDAAMTRDMLEAALRAYVVHCNATVHHRNTLSPENDEILKAFAETRAVRDREEMPLSLSLSMETEFYPEAEAFFKSNRLSLLGKAGKYALIEFTADVNRQAAVAAVFQLSMAGIRPIVVHPERFYFVQSHPETAGEMQGRGALIMPNATSLVGQYGTTAMLTAEKILQSGQADALSSDAHRPDYYETYLEGCSVVAKKYGLSLLRELTWKTPCRILGYEPQSEKDDLVPSVPEYNQ